MWGCTFWFPHASSRGWWVGWDVQHTCSSPLPLRTAMRLDASFVFMAFAMCSSQLSAMDVSVRATMKGAAKCDKHCELQNSVNRQGLERILCFWDIPESMPASVSTLCCSSSCNPLRGMLLVISCASGRALSALLRCSMDKALLRQPAY